MMFKNSPVKNLTSHRNQAMNLRCKSVYWFLPDMSLHRRGLLSGAKYKNKILYKTHR